MKRNKYIKRETDSVIGYVILNEDRVYQDLRRNHENIVHRYTAGDRLAIARAIVTNAGKSFRIVNTINWIPEQICVPDNAVINAAHRNPDPIVDNRITSAMLNDVNQFINPVNRVKVNNVSGKVNTVTKFTINNQQPTHIIKRNYKTMDKSTLKSLISSLTPGQVISMTFIGDKAHLSRDWTVVKVRTGKGKGGSKLLELVDSARNTITTGTPDSGHILNMTVDGTLHGHTSEGSVPVAFETNAARSVELKDAFKNLLRAEGDRQVSIESNIADLNGTFSVNRATQLRGRGGQIRLELENLSTGARTEVWSLRHSGVITTFTILN